MRDLLECKIQERINTSNAIMGVFIDGNGKISEEVMFIFDSLKKKDGDKKAKQITNLLNTKLKNGKRI